MSTRCTVNFTYGKDIVAKVYIHGDGYPDSEHGMVARLEEFFATVKEQTKDTRFRDPSYLAAKFVVWVADQHATAYVGEGEWKKTSMLDFISVGVLLTDPGDIEYTYFVNCDEMTENNTPMFRWKKV